MIKYILICPKCPTYTTHSHVGELVVRAGEIVVRAGEIDVNQFSAGWHSWPAGSLTYCWYINTCIFKMFLHNFMHAIYIRAFINGKIYFSMIQMSNLNYKHLHDGQLVVPADQTAVCQSSAGW
jgi:hypothetical protein